ncbi:MAG: RcnB family protein [Sphingomicrobium sp.]
MRKLILSLLLAGVAATPALAAQDTLTPAQRARADRQQAQSDRRQARDDSRSEARSVARPARDQRTSDFTRPTAPSYQPRSNDFARPSAPAYQPRSNGVVRPTQPQYSGQPDWRSGQGQQIRDDRQAQTRQRVEDARSRVQDQRDLRQQTRVPRPDRNRPPVISTTPRPGTQPPPPSPTQTRYTPAPQWNSSWRHDNRYDWQNYRNRHRSRFHLGFYYDPFGWGYQQYSVGWRLWPSYYGSNFWIDDPWSYRLPYAPPGTRWIRYYDDALLVDTWSGQVVDVIYQFFW